MDTTTQDTLTITLTREEASRVLEAVYLQANFFAESANDWDGREPGVTGLDMAKHLREKAAALRVLMPEFVITTGEWD